MDKWVNRYTNHKVHADLVIFLDELNQILGQELPKEIYDDISRLKLSIEHIQQILSQAIPHLVTEHQLNNIASSAQNSLSELRNYNSNRNVGHIENANSNIEQALSTAQALPTLKPSKKEGLASLITHFSKNIQNTIDDLTQKKVGIENELKQTQDNISALKNDLQSLLSALQKQQESILNLSTQFQEQFFNQQEERRKEFGNEVAKLKEQSEALISELDQKFTEEAQDLEKGVLDLQKNIQLGGETFVSELQNKSEKASKLLESVGITTHTYGYAGVANQERQSGNWLRSFAIILMLISVGILIGPTLFHLVIERTAVDWQNILYRIPTSIIVFIPAFYLAREAAKHREFEVQNKRIELELAALNPYLELFKEDEKNKIKEELVRNYFIGHALPGSKETTDEAEWLSKALPEIISKVVDKVLDRIGIERK